MSEKNGRFVPPGCRAVRAARAVALAAILASFPLPAAPQQKPDDLTNHSIEDLMNIEVTSVSKTEQKLSRTASAVFVITQEDIRRSGATSVPDLLRTVPGLQVAQINANTWAISVRGFNNRFTNKLLVLVDGRSVYTPTFGGVYWDMLDLPLEDIQRIEVIRGPGGSIWGANAVNGVINIVTKKASETPGGLIVAGGGNVNQGFGTVQYGGKASQSTDYRVYTKYFNNNHFPGLSGQDGGDGWHMFQGGFRSDTTISPKDTLTFEGNIYVGRDGLPASAFPSLTTPAPVPTEIFVNTGGGFIQGVWNRQYSSRSDTTLQVSYDQYERSDLLRDTRNTFDATFQHHFLKGERHSIVWGLEYRDSNVRTKGDLFVSFAPADINTWLLGGFVQDEIAVVPNRFYVTAGTKIEHGYYTGFNIMPSARAVWTPSPNQALWASISDAVRSPADADVASRLTLGSSVEPDGTLAVLAITGNPRIDDESLVAYEAGYRRMIRRQLSIDFAAYYNNYNHLETLEPSAPFLESTPAPPHLLVPLVLENLMHGEVHGFEVAANWKVADRWTLSPGYAFERIHMHLAATSQDTVSVGLEDGGTPVHSAQLRSHVTLPHRLAWDASAYFVDRLVGPGVPSYTRFDSGVSWQFAEKARLSVIGENLVRDHHAEFVEFTETARTTLIKRGAYVQLTWQF